MGTRKLLDINLDRELDGSIVSSARLVDGDGSATFALEPTRNSQDRSRISFLHLVTKRGLDREKRAFYSLTAELGLRSGGAERLRLRVEVLDINDNPPVFQEDRYAVKVNRSLPAKSRLLAVAARDADAGKNSRVTYHLEQGSQLAERFSVGRDDGVLSTRAALSCDGEEKCPKCLLPKSGEPCSLLVYAKDGGRPQQSSYTVVKVSLVEANDHDPSITIRYVENTNFEKICLTNKTFICSRNLPDQSRKYSVISSTSVAGTSVAAVTVSDPDPGKHGRISSLEVSSGNEDANFVLERFGGGHGVGGNVFLVRIATGARFRKGQTFTLALVAKDDGSPQRSAKANIDIRVEDKNEFKPEFERDSFAGEVSESAQIGTSVLVVTATDGDGDSSDGNKILYSIVDSQPPYKWFRLHPFSGMITVADHLDREKTSKVVLKVKAQDGRDGDGGPTSAKSSFATVEIVVSDANDIAPAFTKASIDNITVSESTAVNTVVHKVQAEDGDVGEAGKVVYAITSGGEYFSINPTTGVITVEKSLDREASSIVLVSVIATDGGSPPLSSSMSFTVTVLDVNDNTPTFYPTKRVISLDQIKVTGVVFTAYADDGDEGEAGRVSYFWQDPSEVPPFLSLNTTSGEVEAKKNRRLYEANVKVGAMDGDGKRATKPLELVLAKRMKQPQGVQIFELEEDDTVAGRDIGMVDRKGESDGGTFELLDGDPDGVLDINGKTGVISAVGPLDRERKAVYDLLILYTTPNDLYVLLKASLKVIDKNDNSPKFVDLSTEEIIVEGDAPLGSPVYKVLVTDLDEGNNGMVEYRLTDPDDDLMIDEDTGVIYLKSNVDRRSARGRMIEVMATDLGGQRLSEKRKYSVKYKFGNRHTPAFNFDHQEVSVSETTPLNTRILSLPASDGDEGEDGVVTYALTGTDPATEATFGVLPGGDVYLLAPLDRETRPGYAFTVTAIDGGGPPRSSSTSVVIRVTDENDNAPRFGSPDYAFDVAENGEAGIVVGQISASDPDQGRNAELSYSLGRLERKSPVAKYFKLDATTGLITSLQVIDRERLISEIGRDFFQVRLFFAFIYKLLTLK